MKMKTGILVVVLAVGTAAAQNANVVENTRSTMKAVEKKQTAESNAALGIVPGQGTKPSPASSAPAVKPSPMAVKAQAKPAPKAVAAPQVKPTPMGKVAGAQKTAAKGEQAAVKNPEAGEKKYSMSGKRDPFISPVVAHAGGSGCSTGKKCLEIGQIALKGVVQAESGFIAVVTNTLNKAYFLREKDPVFNGYVVKITGDSIVFKETYQDRLGKSFTREVVKKITTPAV